MKKYFSIALIASLFVACDGNEEKVRELQKDKEELKKELDRKDSSMYTFINSVNEIEDNLQEIKERENIIAMSAKKGEDVPENKTDKIKQDIQMINNLLEENDRKIARLTSQLQSSNADIAGFKKMISRLKSRISEKDRQIDSLKSELQKMNFAMEDLDALVDTLAEANERQTEKIIDQEEELNTAYYAFGTFKELKEQGVVTKEGGIIGIGSTEKLKDNFNKDYFTEIDIRRKESIPLFVEKAEIVTSHPTSAYKWIGEDKKIDSIRITNPRAFWSASKYLVVVVD